MHMMTRNRIIPRRRRFTRKKRYSLWTGAIPTRGENHKTPIRIKRQQTTPKSRTIVKRFKASSPSSGIKGVAKTLFASEISENEGFDFEPLPDDAEAESLNDVNDADLDDLLKLIPSVLQEFRNANLSKYL